MVQAIENGTEVEGLVTDVLPVADGARQVAVHLDVRRVAAVDGLPDLVGDVVGQVLEVRVDTARAEDEGVRVGRQLRARVERVSPTVVVAHPRHLRCVDG